MLGAGGSAVVTAGHALVADLNPEHRAAALNLLDLFFGVGAFTTPFLIVPLQDWGGLTAVLMVLAVLAGLVFLYVAAVRFPPPLKAEEFSISEAAAIVGSGLFLVPALLLFLYVGTEQAVSNWQVTYFVRELGVNQISAARLLAIFPVAIMVGRFVNNRLLMRVAPAPVLLASTVGSVVCFGLMLTARSPLVAGVFMFAIGLFMASIFPTTLGIVSARFARSSGTALGLAIAFGWLGTVAIAPALGFVAERRDFSAAYLVVVASALAMVVIAAVLMRQKGRRTEREA